MTHSCVFFNHEIDTLLFTGQYLEFERFFRFDSKGADRSAVQNLTMSNLSNILYTHNEVNMTASQYVKWLAIKIPLMLKGFPNANLMFEVNGMELERHIVGRNGREVVFMDDDEEIEFSDGEVVYPGFVEDIEFREGPRAFGDDVEAISSKQQSYALKGWHSRSISLVPASALL